MGEVPLRWQNLPGCYLRYQLLVLEVGVDQFALYLPREVIREALCNHQITGGFVNLTWPLSMA